MTRSGTRPRLLTSSMLVGMAASLAAGGGAVAQDEEGDDEDVIVVTGTLLRRAPPTSPVTVLDEASFDARGISTVQDAIQKLTLSNGPALTNSFSANGAFAGGASGASLRGLSVSSTLVLFDGLRAAYYPLADDGTRNFVDLNTIPDDIVERVEVLRDGASSTYGADAIAGVINIITKRDFQGVSARAETGLSSRGDAEQTRLSLTAGVGDYARDGINAYVNFSTYRSELLRNADRPFPFNTDDWSTICHPDPETGEDVCNSNGILNGVNPGSAFTLSTAANFMFRPAELDADGTPIPVPGSRFEMLNPDCGPGTELILTPEQLATSAIAPANGRVCQFDYTNLFGVIEPEIERFGMSGNVSARLWEGAEGYVQANFLQSTVSYNQFPPVVRGNANTGIFFPRFSSSAVGPDLLHLPVWVCPDRVDCENDPLRDLNPNNPYAADGQVALVIGRDMFNGPTHDETRNRAYRVAGGIEGELANGWAYDVGASAMHVDLTNEQTGYVYIQHMLDVIADGTYNWIDPAANSQEVLDYLKPDNLTQASSDQLQLQGAVTIPVFELPGGTSELAVGASARYEAVDAPSANSDINGPTERYFEPNAFGTKGSRQVYSASFEYNAPIIPGLDVNVGGRFDDYSSGQSHFSPKVGASYTPFDMLTLRASYSEGFRIPSFAEANALPTTGFVTNNVSLFNDAYLAQYGCTTADFSACPAYIRSGSFGQTTLASPDLEPEESTSFTIGGDIEPIDGLHLYADFYQIEKTGAIVQPSNAPALAAYYTGQPIPEGYVVIPDAPDPSFPNATPRVAFVQAHFINANTIRTEGVDFGGSYDVDITDDIHLRSSLDASYILYLKTFFPDGTWERYDGTLGNFTLTSGSGTPSWRGTWVNTVSYGMFDISGTINYFDGYNLSAMDQGTLYKDCGLSDGTTPCDVDAYVTVDLNGQAHINDKVTLYGTVLNVLDEMPPVDVITYGAHGYNAVQGGTGIQGAYFKAGVKVEF